jgi:hypothetical protein
MEPFEEPTSREVGMRRNVGLSIALSVVFAIAAIMGVTQEKVQSRAYVGHENDRDIQNFIRQYPKAAGTRLDDCQTCHRSGVAGTDTEREYSPCGYCHLLQYPNPRYKTGVPKNYEETLNSYGLAYKKAGRTAEALATIAALDSDGDGFPNFQEIAELRYPGDAGSRPGQPLAPFVTLTWSEIGKLARQTQFMLMNTTSEPFDEYTTYAGVRVKDLLATVHVDLNGAAGITVFAPDGYSIDYTMDDITGPFPKPYFYAAPGNIQDQEMALVKYPPSIPPGVQDGKEIPTVPWLLLAFERDGKPLASAQYEKGTGRLTGEGPYRLVKPQRDVSGDESKPGRPDRSVKSKTFGDGWDYSKTLDHNAGSCVRGATVIRINPMPAGFEEYDWKNGWPLVSGRQIVIFGKGVQKR